MPAREESRALTSKPARELGQGISGTEQTVGLAFRPYVKGRSGNRIDRLVAAAVPTGIIVGYGWR